MKVLLALFLVSSSAFAKDCSSDFSCSYGQKCVKDSYQIDGTCMNVVNSFGNREFAPPELKSIGPKMETGCYTDSQCKYDEKCFKNNNYSSSGTCVKR